MKQWMTCIILTALLCGTAAAADERDAQIQSALSRAGDNADQLRKALDEVPEDRADAMRFLIASMPERDLQTLSADFLLDNVEYACRAWNEASWKDRIPHAIFLNDLLPYACINERRDNWRADFYERFKPLVADAKTPSEAAIILNRHIFPLLNVKFSRQRPKADQSPYETIEAGMASCTGLSVLLIDACRAVGVPARLAGTPLWTDNSGNHSWVEIWDGRWHYTGAAEPADRLNDAWFTQKAATAQADHPRHAIYAVSFKPTDRVFPMVWNRDIDDVYAVNVTDRYTLPGETNEDRTELTRQSATFDVEASLHAVEQLADHLQIPRADRPPLGEQVFAEVPLTAQDAQKAQNLLWTDHAAFIAATRADEMQAKTLTLDGFTMPFFYSVHGDKPDTGRSLYISLHGGGGTTQAVNDSQWNNQKKLYHIDEGVYLVPRSPTNTWNMWHQDHIDPMFDRLIENLIVFEDVNPDRVYLLGYSAGGDGVYRLAPRMADRWAAASMMAGHPGDTSAVNLYNTPFTIHVGGQDSAYDRNTVAAEWGQQLDALQQAEPDGYVHWTKIYADKGHWIDRGAADALPWMQQYTRDPLPDDIIWRQDRHKRFYWLAVETLQPGAVVRARRSGQTIDVEPGSANTLLIRLNDRMADLDQPVTVTAGSRCLFQGRPNRTIATLAATLAERGDPAAIFSAEIRIDGRP